MARDDTARDSDSEQSLLDRRSHLQLAGATAAKIAGAEAGAATSTAATDDDTNSTPADEARFIPLDDDSASVEVQDGS